MSDLTEACVDLMVQAEAEAGFVTDRTASRLALDALIADGKVIPVEDIDYKAAKKAYNDAPIPCLAEDFVRRIVDAALHLENLPKTPTPENP